MRSCISLPHQKAPLCRFGKFRIPSRLAFFNFLAVSFGAPLPAAFQTKARDSAFPKPRQAPKCHRGSGSLSSAALRRLRRASDPPKQSRVFRSPLPSRSWRKAPRAVSVPYRKDGTALPFAICHRSPRSQKTHRTACPPFQRAPSFLW